MQFLGLASVVAILGVAGAGAASTLRNNRTAETTSEGTVSVAEKQPAAAEGKRATVSTEAPAVLQSTPPVVSAPASDSAPAPATTTPQAPVVGKTGFVLSEGQTQLTDSIYAIRAGDSVLVNFDRYGYRTRRSDKFEASLRTTLPLIYGRSVTTFIDSLLPGQLVTERDVIGALATSGMLVILDNGAEVRIRVLTRVGSDGPLAVGYLTTIAK